MKSIAFSKPMVLARREGAKTQTRRVLKTQPKLWASSVPGAEDCGGLEWRGRVYEADREPFIEHAGPYGAPGDRLWVREAFAFSSHYDDVPPRDVPKGALVYYRADGEKQRGRVGRWRPPMFMPKWAARDAIRITDLRVERLRDISNADAIREGVTRTDDGGWLDYTGRGPWDQPKHSFLSLWASINGEGSWKENPWVWVLTFLEDGAP